MDKEPHIDSAPAVRYPRAADQVPTPAPEASDKPRWVAALIDALGLVAVVWIIPAAIVIVGLPIALVVALATWLGR